MNSTGGASGLRLLQAIAGSEHGGAEAFFVRFALALERAGVDQHILVRSGRPWAAALSDGGLQPVALPFGGWTDFTTRRAFAREIKTFSPHVVLTWMSRASHLCPTRVSGQTFTHVARLGGFSRAAEALLITQPAISEQVRKLEERLVPVTTVNTGFNLKPRTPISTVPVIFWCIGRN